MKKVLFCTPYEGVSNSNIGGISVWAKAIMAYYKEVTSAVELVVCPLDRKTYVRGVNAVVRLWSGIVEYISLVKNVKGRIKSEPFDSIHLCTTASLGLIKDWLILRYAKAKGMTTLLHFHCGRIPEIINRNNWETYLLKRVLRMTDTALVMDATSLEALQRWGFRNGVNMPNPLSTFVCQTVGRLQAKVERIPRQLLFVGHVVDIKGVYELVEACSAMNVALRMVGHVEDSVKKHLMDIAAKREGEWLCFTGGLSREDTLREMLAADILVVPSYIEGFPNVILEGMACGTPIVASRVGAIPEMLAGGECGVLIEPRKEDEIRAAVEMLLNDIEKKKRIAQLAQERVERLYSIASVWNQLEEIWKKG